MGKRKSERWDAVGPSPRFSERDAALIKRVLSMRNGADLPEHKYTLAKDDSQYSGPSWVPFNLWHLCEFARNPVVKDYAQKLAKHPTAKALWDAIARRYARPDIVAGNLPVACANAWADWQTQPRLTPSKFKQGRTRLARIAKQLAVELERFFLARDEDDHEEIGLLYFTQLMTPTEEERFNVAIRRVTWMIANRACRRAGTQLAEWNEYTFDEKGTMFSTADMDAHLVWSLMLPEVDGKYVVSDYGGVPTLPDLLRRIADRFEADGDDPPLSRLRGTNTERNRFARAIVKYFWTSYGDVSPSIVAHIVSVFFAQGISDNDVSQIIRKVKAAHPLQQASTSILKLPPRKNG